MARFNRVLGAVNILEDAIATGAGETHQPWNAKRTFQAQGVTSAGAGTATITISGSNDGTNWVLFGTITLVLATTVATGGPGVDGFASDAPWAYVRANLTVVTGTDATVNVYMGA